MKRSLAVLVLLGLVASCAVFAPRPMVVTVLAQSVPVTKALAWDPNPASEGVTNYAVTLDGTIVGSPVAPTQAVTFATVGSHTLTVRAVNAFSQSAASTLVVNVIVPSAPVNLRLP
jgi:hypothetical protein